MQTESRLRYLDVLHVELSLIPNLKQTKVNFSFIANTFTPNTVKKVPVYFNAETILRVTRTT